MTKALLFDLDNTIFPTPTITDEVFSGVFELMQGFRGTISNDKLAEIKAELSRTPFQKIADQYGFPEELRRKGIALLKETVCQKPIATYPDYELVRSLPLPKFLVTFGFVKLQQSKVDCLGIRNDFKAVVVVDPEISRETKRNVFLRIMDTFHYQKDELIAIGDDPESEIKAARDLGIPTYLYDPKSRFKSKGVTWHEQSYRKLRELLENKKD